MSNKVNNDWKTPLGIYEKLIYDLKKEKRELQESKREFQEKIDRIKIEITPLLEAAKTVEAYKKESELLTLEPQKIRGEYDASKVNKLERELRDARIATDNLTSEIQTLRQEMDNKPAKNINSILEELFRIKDQITQLHGNRSELQDIHELLHKMHLQVSNLEDELTLA